MVDHNSYFRISRIDDATAIDFINRIRGVFCGDGSFSGEVDIFLASNLQISIDRFFELSNGAGLFTIVRAALNANSPTGISISLNYSRSIQLDGRRISTSNIDEIYFMLNGERRRWDEYADRVMRLNKEISDLDAGASPVRLPEQVSAEPIRDTLKALSATHIRMIEQLDQSLKSLIERREHVEQAAEERRREQEEHYQVSLKAIEDERRKLELQSSTAERRRIAKSIGEMARNFSQSRRQFSSHIHGFGIAVGLIALFAALASATVSVNSILAYQVLSDEISFFNNTVGNLSDAELSIEVGNFVDSFTIPSWFLLGKSFLSGLFSVGAFTYAASWFRRYYQEDLSQAQELQRLDADVARASWVVEAIHEIQNEAKAELPPAWVEAVTKNLFGHEGSRSHVDDAALALRALMGFSAGAKVGPNGAEIQIGRKGAKALSQAEE